MLNKIIPIWMSVVHCQIIQNFIFGDFSSIKHYMWYMFNNMLLFLTCNANTQNQGHNIGPLNLYKLQKKFTLNYAETPQYPKKKDCKHQLRNIWSHLSTHLPTRIGTVNNFLFKKCPYIRLPCEHWTIWQIWQNYRKSIKYI